MRATPQNPNRHRRLVRAAEADGFTLVEILVVMLILALLAAIAIPTFFGQRDKAKDTEAKAEARTVVRALETYATDNSGEYSGATVLGLIGLEPTLVTADFELADLGPKTFLVTATSDSGNTFSIERQAGGAEILDCTAHGTSGCPENGGW